ncbi:hypothetical protein BT93_L5455 [Corymbia citriodora subsp. variegata]|uniref:Uncharacterized protein n=1 Tax=Corymbia citriodora subsp. variegata TaxID=360336 RepID=A0A8T0CIV6_CORYI|nr:hypothetical protein BT93_L5455 [Corymbia citriodora subsp. variegata]
MQSLKAVFFKPDPAEQKRKCDQLIKKNVRAIDKDIANMRNLESKTKSLILSASRRAERNPAHAKQARQEARLFAKEMVGIRRQSARLYTSKAQLQSVNMQVNEAFSIRKIEGSMKISTGIMKDVNSLIKLPELTGTMNELSQELMKAGIIEEMVGDTIDNQTLLDDEEEAEAEVDAVLGEVLKGKLGTISQDLPTLPADEEEETPEQREADLEQMRGRLEALRS